MNFESRNFIKYFFLFWDNFWFLFEECKRLNIFVMFVFIGVNRCFVVGFVNGVEKFVCLYRKKL